MKTICKLLTPLKDKQMNEYFNVIMKPFNPSETIAVISGIFASIVVWIVSFSENYLGISGAFATMLLIVLLADFITAIIVTIKLKITRTSKEGRRTIYKTGAYIVFIYAAFMLHEELGDRAPLFKSILQYLHIFLLIHITFWELFSIDENLQKMGINLGITDFLKGIYDNIKNIFMNIGKINK